MKIYLLIPAPLMLTAGLCYHEKVTLTKRICWCIHEVFIYVQIINVANVFLDEAKYI